MIFIRNNKKWLVIIVVLIILFSSQDKEQAPKTNKESNKSAQIVTEKNEQSDVENPSNYEAKDVKPKGIRLLGIGISEGTIGFDKSFTLAKNIGVRVIELPTAWNDGEPDSKQYVKGWFPLADQFYPDAGIKLALSLNPIDSNNIRLPKDLQNKSFNDPEVIERYKAFVDFVATQLPRSNIYYVAIGNEIDMYLGNSEKRWQEYSDFFEIVAPYVRKKFPNATIGAKITYEGIIKHESNTNRIISASDAVLTTYYPMNSGFVVKEPNIVYKNFENIVNLYPKKKIYFTEIGYPSGALNKSSEAMQARFIRESFAAWDIYSDRIPLLNFQWLHDASPDTVVSWQKYYGLKDKEFASFLSTLGLRTYDGKDKQSFKAIQEETKKRDW